MGDRSQIVSEYARMWPREVFYCLLENGSGKRKKVQLAKGLELVNKPGVYVLYRDGVPYYVGQATKLRHRLWAHACSPGARYYNFWNHFSAFVVEDRGLRSQVEAILIAAMPTANGARPRLKRARIPVVVSRMSRDIYRHQANPKEAFEGLTHRLRKLEQVLKRNRSRRELD